MHSDTMCLACPMINDELGVCTLYWKRFLVFRMRLLETVIFRGLKFRCSYHCEVEAAFLNMKIVFGSVDVC